MDKEKWISNRPTSSPNTGTQQINLDIPVPSYSGDKYELQSSSEPLSFLSKTPYINPNGTYVLMSVNRFQKSHVAYFSLLYITLPNCKLFKYLLVQWYQYFFDQLLFFVPVSLSKVRR